MVLLSMLLVSAQAVSPMQERADNFLNLVNDSYKALYYVASQAQWDAATDVTPEHDAATEAAGKAMAAFTGNPSLIKTAKELLEHKDELTPITVRELQRVLLNAAEGPMTNPKLVAERVEAEAKQASVMNSFEFKLDGKPITANEIDDLLDKSKDLKQRQAVWEASKQSGVALKPGLVKLQGLRNGVAKSSAIPTTSACRSRATA